MSDPRDDREFEAWLAGDSPVSEAYRQTAAEQPPTELDARVLAAAEQELKVVPIRAARRWRRRGAAVGIAATFVLAVSLLLQTVTEAPLEEAVILEDRADELKQRSMDSGRFEARDEALEDAPLSAPAAQRPRPMMDLMEMQAGSDEDVLRAILIPLEPAEKVQRAQPVLPEQPATAASAPQKPADSSPAESQKAEAELSGMPSPGVRSQEEIAADTTVEGFSPSPAPTPEDVLLAAVPLILDHQALAGAGSAMEDIIVSSRRQMTREEARLERERERAAEARRQAREAMEAELDLVIELYEQDQQARAFEQLEAFREQYPEHPVSVSLREQGY